METKQFIEDAEKGGFRSITVFGIVNPEKILLDPLAWQAVGKTRGHKYPKDMMISFMTHLADGKSIEEALAAIL